MKKGEREGGREGRYLSMPKKELVSGFVPASRLVLEGAERKDPCGVDALAEGRDLLEDDRKLYLF